MGVIAIIYSYTGGLKSVLWTDFIQGSVLLVGVTFALFYLAHGIDGGFGSIFSTMGQGKFLAPDQPIFNPNILKDSVFLLIVGAVPAVPHPEAFFLQFPPSLYLPYRHSRPCRLRLL